MGGFLNPKDRGRTSLVRPAETNQGGNQRRWYDPSKSPRLYAQDMNRILAQFRAALDYFDITDEEGDDTALRKIAQASVLSASITPTGGLNGRGLSDWFSDSINVIAEGAAGDDLAGSPGTDDAVAINAAIARSVADGKVLYFPKRRYRIGSAITLLDGAQIKFDMGAKLIKDFSGNTITQPSLSTSIQCDTDNFTVEARDHTKTGAIFFLNLKDSIWNNPKVLKYAGGQAFLIALHRSFVYNPNVTGSPESTGTGAFRLYGGEDSSIFGGWMESGDDVLQFVTGAGPGSAIFNKPIKNCWYIGCRGRSRLGRLAIVALDDTTNVDVESSGWQACGGYGGNRLVYWQNTTGNDWSAKIHRDGTTGFSGIPLSNRSFRIFQVGEQVTFSGVGDASYDKTVTIASVGDQVTGALSGVVFNSAGTITRASGSFVADGFAVGDYVVPLKTGAANDSVVFRVTAITPTQFTVSPAPTNETINLDNITNRATIRWADVESPGTAGGTPIANRTNPGTLRDVRFLAGQLDGENDIGAQHIFVDGKGPMHGCEIDAYLRKPKAVLLRTSSNVRASDFRFKIRNDIPSAIADHLISLNGSGTMRLDGRIVGNSLAAFDTIRISGPAVQINAELVGIGNGVFGVNVLVGYADLAAKLVSGHVDARGFRVATGASADIDGADFSGLTTTTTANQVAAVTGSIIRLIPGRNRGLTEEHTFASAATIDLTTRAQRRLVISGTTTVTAFTAPPNQEWICRATGAFILTHNATSLILPAGGSNITTAVGDTWRMVSNASGNIRVTNYQRASGAALA